MNIINERQLNLLRERAANGGYTEAQLRSMDFKGIKMNGLGTMIEVSPYELRVLLERYDAVVPLRACVERIKFRLHFIGWPAEPYWNGKARDEERDMWTPDWRYECQLIEHVLHGSPIETPEKPTDTVPRNQLPPPPVLLTCVYCGQQYPPGTPASQHEALDAHIKTCEKHPLRAAEERIAKLESVIDGAKSCLYAMRGVDELADKTFELLDQEVPTLDLELSFLRAMKQAVAESKWMPDEYTANDWQADVLDLLRNGPGIVMEDSRNIAPSKPSSDPNYEEVPAGKQIVRGRFYVDNSRSIPRTMVSEPSHKYPWWITGYSGDDVVIVAYADSDDDLRYRWPELNRLDVTLTDVFKFSSRFPKPEGWVNPT